MKQQAITVLLQAYFELQQTAFKLYEESDMFFDRGDLLEAGIIQGVADKIYEEAENLDVFITEMEPQ